MSNPEKILHFEKFNFYSVCLIVGAVTFFYLYTLISNLVYTPDKVTIVELIVSVILISAMFFILANFFQLKLTMTDHYIEAKYGIFKKKVALKDILSLKPHEYKFSDFWGWGIRGNFKGTVAYNIPGDDYKGLLIEYKSGNKDKKLFISSREPEKIAGLYNGLIDIDR